LPLAVDGFTIEPDSDTITNLGNNGLPDPFCKRCKKAIDVDYCLDLDEPTVPCECFD
jgi:hypothetical protein